MKTDVKTQSIVKIDPSQYGLTESKAKEIETMFKPMLDKMVELENEFNNVQALKMSEEKCQAARDLRLQYVKVRTGTAAIHKDLKAFYLNGGRFVDGWKNAQLFASQGIEDKLSAIENHYENLEKERIAKLQEKRSSELAKYEVEYIPDNLGSMPEGVWSNFLLGTKTNYEAQKEAEHKAEEERIAREKAEAEERERIRKENEQLKKEAEERERQAKIEAEKRAKEEAERLKKEEAERKIREEKECKEREAYEAKIQKEREEREKAEAQIKAIKEAKEKSKAEEQARIKVEQEAKEKAEREAQLAPDKKKLEILTEDILRIILNSIPEVKNPEAIKIIEEVIVRLEEIRQYIFNQSKSL